MAVTANKENGLFAHSALQIWLNKPYNRTMMLEDYRNENGLTYEALAKLIAVSSARQAHRYAVGSAVPRTEIVERIIRATEGIVTPNDLHAARVAWLREHGHFSGPASSAEADA